MEVIGLMLIIGILMSMAVAIQCSNKASEYQNFLAVLEYDNAKLTETLRFYADEDNYNTNDVTLSIEDGRIESKLWKDVMQDGGERARRAIDEKLKYNKYNK